MEKTPAAYSMEWSIELEKGIRSKSPAKRIEAISKFGSRLEWWNRQPDVSGAAEFKMFGLIPGEEKLFLNAILLRLSDAFQKGDKRVKLCIVKTCLKELKSRRKRVQGEEVKEGVFSKSKLINYLEILTRVKIVLENVGDIEDRALALYLLGCWADFAKDCACIRYSILSSLSLANGDNILEMKASLFAAMRFSELADDFACVFLGILTNKLGSMETSPAFKLAGCRVFGQMGRCSFSVSSGAYKAGLQLLLDSAQLDQTSSIEMLVSLTKITSRWTMLITSHMELLSTFFFKDDTAVPIQVVTLNCFKFVLANGVWYPSSVAARGMITSFIDLVSKSDFSSALWGRTLKVLHQMLCYYLPTCHVSEMLEVLSMLFLCINNMFQSSTMSERLFVIWMLLDILGKSLGRDRVESREIVSTLANQVTTFVMDRVYVLMKLDIGKYQSSEETWKEVKSLLRLILNLIENHSDVCALILDKLTILIKHLVDLVGDIKLEKEDVISGYILKYGASNPLRYVVYLAKMTNISLNNLEAKQSVSYEVIDPLKLIVDSVLISASPQLYTQSIYMLLLHFRGSYVSIWQERNHVTDDLGNYNLPCGDFFGQYDPLIVESANKMFERREYWSSYKAGKHAACHGHWSMATFIFEQLTKLVLSDSNYLWLKSLALISRSESHLEASGCDPLKKRLFQGEGIVSVFIPSHYAEALDEACNGLHAARRTLDGSIPGLSTKFLDWFLFLRAKVLELMKETICLLGGVSFTQVTDRSMPNEVLVPLPHLITLEMLRSLVCSLSQISFRLNKVVNECDLLAVSFVGMDTKSAMRISAIGASCSLLAFSTGFALSVPLLYASAEDFISCLESSEEHLHVRLIHDLFERLNLTESETRESLLMLLRVYKKSVRCLLPNSQNTGMGVCCRARDFVKLSRYVVTTIVNLKNEATQTSTGKSLSEFAVDGFQLLLRVIFKSMHFPFKFPSHFFRIRPDIKSELFFMDGDGKIVDRLSVPLGSPLSLNVSLQVKNMPSYLPARLAKLYCILSCVKQTQTPQGNSTGQSGLNSEKWENDEMLDLNEKLVNYVIGSSKCKASNSLNVEEYLHFQPNEKGQGFSTCFLDISAFPVGIYRIQWHSCFLDNKGCYWNLLPLNAGSSFTIAKPPCSRMGEVEQFSN